MMERYPLSWPAGWPRIEGRNRKRAQFSKGVRQYSQSGEGSWLLRKSNLSVSNGVERILGELSRLGIATGDAIISTNVETRLDGLPYSNRGEPIDPGVAVYWRTRKGETRVMAIDRYDRVADNLAAVAATLEAMRAIERHGGAQILDRAFTGFDALPAPGSLREWWEILECGRDAALEVARAQYRRKASENHPDRGGSHDQMTAINRAWTQAQEALGG